MRGRPLCLPLRPYLLTEVGGLQFNIFSSVTRWSFRENGREGGGEQQLPFPQELTDDLFVSDEVGSRPPVAMKHLL